MNARASTLAFDEAVEDVSGGNIKVPRGDYRQTGPFPVVDQGQDHVGGFAEDASYLVRGQGPWIVFGDHTRALKYLDVPFCMGADGIKVLKPRNPDRLDAKFLYHFLSAAEVPNAGYSRHFKFLRRLEVPLPPLDEQRRIAALLDKADALRRKRKCALNLLDSLTHSIFLEMFDLSQPQASDWPKRIIADLSLRVTKGESPGWQGFDYESEGVRFITSENVGWGTLLRKDKFISNDFNKKIRRSELRGHDLLINLVGASIGRAALMTPCLLPANVNQAVSVTTLDERQVHPRFVLQQILSPDGQRALLGEVVEAARANISLANVRELEVRVPPLSLQLDFVRKLERLDQQVALSKKALGKTEANFASLQSRAFTGQL